jgi:hypothetical protein
MNLYVISPSRSVCLKQYVCRSCSHFLYFALAQVSLARKTPPALEGHQDTSLFHLLATAKSQRCVSDYRALCLKLA